MMRIAIMVCLLMTGALHAVEPEGRTAVLVHKFTMLGDDPRQTWLGGAIQANFQAEIGRNADFRLVVSTTLPAPGQDQQPMTPAEEARRVAREAGASVVITGAYQVIEGDLRVTGEVIEVASGRVLGRLKVDGTTRELLGIEDKLVAQAVTILQPPKPAEGVAEVNEEEVVPLDEMAEQRGGLGPRRIDLEQPLNVEAPAIEAAKEAEAEYVNWDDDPVILAPSYTTVYYGGGYYYPRWYYRPYYGVGYRYRYYDDWYYPAPYYGFGFSYGWYPRTYLGYYYPVSYYPTYSWWYTPGWSYYGYSSPYCYYPYSIWDYRADRWAAYNYYRHRDNYRGRHDDDRGPRYRADQPRLRRSDDRAVARRGGIGPVRPERQQELARAERREGGASRQQRGALAEGSSRRVDIGNDLQRQGRVDAGVDRASQRQALSRGPEQRPVRPGRDAAEAREQRAERRDGESRVIRIDGFGAEARAAARASEVGPRVIPSREPARAAEASRSVREMSVGRRAESSSSRGIDVSSRRGGDTAGPRIYAPADPPSVRLETSRAVREAPRPEPRMESRPVRESPRIESSRSSGRELRSEVGGGGSFRGGGASFGRGGGGGGRGR